RCALLRELALNTQYPQFYWGPVVPDSGDWMVICSSVRRVFRRRARSFIITKKTGTRIRTWIVDVIMPPTIGAAMGFITSEPIPVAQSSGTRLASTAHTVMSFGLK